MSIKEHHYIISDLHLGHKNILKYGNRDFAETVEEHDTILINNILAVPAHEVVWIVGDVAMKLNKLHDLREAECTLGLVGGNHDSFKKRHYDMVFTHIRGAAQISCKDGRRGIVTHIPVHIDSLFRFDFNMHGHLHEHEVGDPRYINCCVEHVGVKPVLISDLLAKLPTAS